MAEQQQQRRKPALDLDALVERRFVRFAGGEYDLLNPEEVSILDYHRIVRQAHRISSMMGDGDGAAERMSDEDVRELSNALDQAVRLILRAPDDVVAKLSDLNKLAIIGVFSTLQRGTSAPTTAPPTESDPKTSTSEN